MNPKICFIIPTSNAGGIETYLLRFLRLHKQSLQAYVIVLSATPGALAEEYNKLEGVSVVHHPIGYYHVHNFVWLYRFLKKYRFNAICDFNGNFAGIPLTIARIAGIQKRLALYRRSSNAFKPSLFNNAYNSLVHALVNINATHIISNSKAALHFFFSKQWQTDKRFHVIANGIPLVSQVLTENEKLDMRKSLGWEPGFKILGHVGRVDPAKNHEALLQVTRLLQDQHTDIRCKLVLCGLGTDSEAFSQRIHQLGIADLVVPLGQRNDVQRLLQCFDIFFFPSLTEGQPNALLEAMGLGLPVVASNIEAIREVLPPEAHEALVNPTDYAAAADQIYKILSAQNPQNKVDLKAWCVRHFDLEKNMKQFLDLLTD